MARFFTLGYVLAYIPMLLTRIHITFIITICAIQLGLFIGTGIAVVRINRIPVLTQIAAVYVSFMRGTPLIVQLFIAYYGVPNMLINIGININRWDPLFFVIISYTLNEAAFLSELIRGAIISVDKGQIEAAHSIGLTNFQTFRRVTAPQAFRVLLPNLANSVVFLLKDTSLAFAIGTIDVMGMAKSIVARTYHSLEAYTAAAIIFLVLSILAEKLFSVLFKKANVGTSVNLG
jgi:L-cystine transport system permease protein